MDTHDLPSGASASSAPVTDSARSAVEYEAWLASEQGQGILSASVAEYDAILANFFPQGISQWWDEVQGFVADEDAER